MTQVYILYLIAYGIGILSLICELHAAHHQVMQPWYADDAGAGGTSAAFHEHTRDLMLRGSPWSYFTETTKSILVVSTMNFP